jgi:hypothetical protein
MRVVVFDDISYSNLSVGKVISLAFVESEIFGWCRQGQKNDAGVVKSLFNRSGEGKIDPVDFLKQLHQPLLIDMRFVLLTALDSCFVDIINHELS